ncbi:MAG: hypothetical protein AAFP98_06620 [Pseudomonadota bacterium]
MKQIVLSALMLSATAAFADAPKVEAVSATKSGDAWRFDVTISHPDTGWDDYADGWEVVDADGNQLGERPLAHPHVNEQPFTRSQSGIVIPDGMTEVYIRVRDNVHGWYDDRYPFTLPN